VIPCRIEAIDLHLPERIETAEDLAPKIGKTAQWIRQRAGVQERRIAQVEMPELAALAAAKVLGEEAPDLILNASGVGYQVLPDSSVFIQRALGLSGIPSFSIHATCLSFLAALQVASGFLATRSYERILIVSADLGSRGRNFEEPESAALLGDGAAAALVTRPKPGENSAILSHLMRTFPEGAEFTAVRGGGTRLHPQDPRTTIADNLFHMLGPAVFKMALREAPPLIDEVLDKAGLSKSEIKIVVPHQASGFGVEVYRRYGFEESQVIDVVSEHGNCVAASIPMALAHAVKSGRLERGEAFMLVGTGAGLSVAASILRY
jgi:3-oxoacyl-[acyl-carrier-protein] synthase-3